MKYPPPILRRLFVLLLLAVPVSTLATPSLPPPRFYIETIEVEGARRVTPEILLSEALLAERTEYGEAELRDAIHRLLRLPFILEARFALEKGSERGKLQLIIEVEEVHRFFFGADLETSFSARDFSFERSFPNDQNTQLFTLAGMRFFPGRHSVGFVSISDGAVQAGFTRYGLGKSGTFLSLGYERQACCQIQVEPLGIDPTFSSWSSGNDSDRGTLALGFYLDRQRSLRFEISYQESHRGDRLPVLEEPGLFTRFEYDDRRTLRLEAAWIHDTTDDSTFPTRGESLAATLEFHDLEADFEMPGQVLDFSQPVLVLPLGVEMRSRMLRGVVTGTRHWPQGRSTFSAGLRLAAGRSEIRNLPTRDGIIPEAELDVWEARLDLRHLFRIYRSSLAEKHRELFWETRASLGYESTSPDLGLLNDSLDRLTFSTGLAYRTSWGIFRLGLTYLDFGRTT